MNEIARFRPLVCFCLFVFCLRRPAHDAITQHFASRRAFISFAFHIVMVTIQYDAMDWNKHFTVTHTDDTDQSINQGEAWRATRCVLRASAPAGLELGRLFLTTDWKSRPVNSAQTRSVPDLLRTSSHVKLETE